MPVRILRMLFGMGAVVTAASLAFGGSGDEVVAKVGPAAVTRAELEAKLASLPPVQRAMYGATLAEQRRHYLEKVVVAELLLSQAALAQKLDERPDVRVRVLGVYRAAVTNALRRELVEGKGVSDDEVARYYEQNKARFQQPERLLLWRILCATEAEARRVLDEAKKPGGEKKWPDLAREHSQDKATSQRGGNLGLVAADGRSNEAPVLVSPALFAAAKKVNDGELVGEPVPEGEGFAVLWRRGTQPAFDQPLAHEAPGIRQLLGRQRVEGTLKEQLERLRKEHVSDLSEDLVDVVEVKKTGDVVPRQRSGVAVPKAPGKPQPSATPGGRLR